MEAALNEKPTVLVVIGMAGSGKTSFVKSLAENIRTKQVYAINLDPAVKSLGYKANIDIRDSVNYKEVMQEFQLGPNGAILTCLNLFATRFSEVLSSLDRRCGNEDLQQDPAVAEGGEYGGQQLGADDLIVVDTPGQIEVFAWSASGSIILGALRASGFRTVTVYVVDGQRCAESPVSFMANMTYACSIFYRMHALPFLLCLNKSDLLASAQRRALDAWLGDFSAFNAALEAEDDQSYITSLSRSLALSLEEFYAALPHASYSSKTSAGLDDLLHKALSLH